MIIFDGQNIAHRSYWVASLKASGSDRSNLALYIFLNSLKGSVRQYGPCDDIWIAWDKKEVWPSTNFRSREASEYKAGRDKESHQEVFEMTEVTMQITNLLGIKTICPYVLEADDCIGWLVQTKGNKPATIVSADKDLLQLIRFPNTRMFSLGKKKLFDPAIFEEEYGFPPSKFAIYKAITGDKSDNIPGIGKFGPKRALKLITEQLWEDLTTEQLKALKHNLKMVDLSGSYLLEENEEAHYVKQKDEQANKKPEWEKAIRFLEDLDFSTPTREVEEWRELFNQAKRLQLFADGDK
jgi:DNA polymerase-1